MTRQDGLSVADAIARHAARDFGTSGLRELALDMFNDDEPVFAYRILHAWLADKHECQSLFVLTEPAIMAGTALKLVERPRAERMDVWLKFANDDQSLFVEPFRHNQSVLGTDFTYEDLRFWLPTDAFETVSPAQIVPDPGVFAFTAVRTVGRSRAELRVTLHAVGWLPLSIEWLDPAHGEPVRSYCAADITCVDRIWTPQRISITRPREGYRSVMTLRNVRHRVAIDPRGFELQNLSAVPVSTFDSWTDHMCNGGDRTRRDATSTSVPRAPSAR